MSCPGIPTSDNEVRILVLEDERKLSDAISERLAKSGYTVVRAYSGEAGLEVLETRPIDLMIMDLMLPGRGGLETLREMRRNGFRLPVLILTAKASVENRVTGLDAGADDYLVKPFAFEELLARLRALHRRLTPTAPSTLQFADICLNTGGRTAERGGRNLDLTEREFDLLEYLMLNASMVVSREMLARDVLKVTVRYTSLDNMIDQHIARLRRKLDDPFPVRLLYTVRGVGFVLRLGEK